MLLTEQVECTHLASQAKLKTSMMRPDTSIRNWVKHTATRHESD